MHHALELLAELDDSDSRWLFEHGVERAAVAGTELVTEDRVPAALFFLLDGLVEVRTRASPSAAVARLGPGEVIGELSFLDGSPASATVVAVEPSTLLEVPTAALSQILDSDPSFAARFYRAIGVLQGRRLRATTRRVWAGRAPAEGDADAGVQAQLSIELDRLKTALLEAEKAAKRHRDVVPDEVRQQLADDVLRFGRDLDRLIGDGSGLSEAARSVFGHRVQLDLLPYVMMSELGERLYSKPRGYPGDFGTIDLIHRGEPKGLGRLGPALDAAIRAQPAIRAIANRRPLLAQEIGRAIGERPSGAPARVASLASGPAAELFDVFAYLADPARLRATCVDIDFQALGFVSAAAEQAGLADAFDLHNGNLVYLATGHKQLALEPQDLIYCSGLTDYFADRFVGALLDWIHDRLRPGGRAIIGNFAAAERGKAMMDHLFEWRVIDRSEAEMHSLFEASKFGRRCTAIRYEPAGVQLFAECVKLG